eukprot:2223746-Rhodomonas_salina.1
MERGEADRRKEDGRGATCAWAAGKSRVASLSATHSPTSGPSMPAGRPSMHREHSRRTCVAQSGTSSWERLRMG